MDFPQHISFTITNTCNLRCRMCGQWSEEGYMHQQAKKHLSELGLSDWKRLVCEAADHKVGTILIRGGEPFLFPGIIELLEYIHSKGMFVAIDTNGTRLENYAEDIVRIGNMHLTFSVDGPEEVHDYVRGVKGSFNKTKANIALLNDLEKKSQTKISKSICFTISRYNYKSLGLMPEVARSMAISSINIVPYYYVPAAVGEKYTEELKNNFSCPAFSWKGFHHEDSGVDFAIFREELKKYLADLKGIENFPYMPIKEEDYRIWFSDSFTPVVSTVCNNVENLIDIQPNGNANFCVDFPDYSFGNIKEAYIEDLWNSPEAVRFRNYRREHPLAVCYRCGAKYMSEL